MIKTQNIVYFHSFNIEHQQTLLITNNLETSTIMITKNSNKILPSHLSDITQIDTCPLIRDMPSDYQIEA
jgi:hypothetical protein